MEPRSLNQHGTDPSIRTGKFREGFGKLYQALPASPPACLAVGVLQSRSRPPALMKL